jgi:hypothetical protein
VVVVAASWPTPIPTASGPATRQAVTTERATALGSKKPIGGSLYPSPNVRTDKEAVDASARATARFVVIAAIDDTAAHFYGRFGEGGIQGVAA